jgi:hypothetical protein
MSLLTQQLPQLFGGSHADAGGAASISAPDASTAASPTLIALIAFPFAAFDDAAM